MSSTDNEATGAPKLQVFDKLAHDTGCGLLIFDLDGDLAAHKLILPKRGQSQTAHRAQNRIDH